MLKNSVRLSSRLLAGITFLIILLTANCSPASAQRFVERGILINPLATVSTESKATDSLNDSMRFLPETYGFGELYYTFDDSVQAWSQRLMFTAELLRISPNQTISFNTNIEFVADPNNSISFNPRAIWFEENLLFTQRQAGWLWQVGYNHRCKHDIDNLSEMEQRGLIYGSVSGRVIFYDDTKPRPQFLASIRSDVYTLLADDRRPFESELLSPDFDHLAVSFGGDAQWNSAGTGFLGWYAKGHFLLNFFGTEEGFSNRISTVEDVALNWGLESGIELRGGAHMQIGFKIEHFHDSEILALPTEVNYFSIGARIFNAAGIW